MDFLFAIAIIAAPIAGVIWYCEAYREARTWKEVHASADHARVGALYSELTRQGIRVKLKNIGSRFNFGFATQSSIRVHREDYAPAAEIVRSFTRG